MNQEQFATTSDKEKAKRLIVTGIGDPRSYTTWSGTPANLIEAIEQAGYAVDAVDSSAIGRFKKLRLMLGYQTSRWQAFLPTPQNIKRQIAWLTAEARSDYARTRRARRHYAKLLRQHLEDETAKKILHLTSLALPLGEHDSSTNHYLMCDSTWHTLREVSDVNNRFTRATLCEFEQAEREAFQSVEHFFPIAEYVKEDLIAHYGIDSKRITVVGTGRGKITAFDGNKDYANGHILFVAKVRFEEKGGLLLIKAFKRAQQVNPRLKLVIVGQEEYREMAIGAPNVRFLGHVPWEELQQLFNDAALYAMPATAEPWGLVYLEALACKTPILGLNRHAIPELTGHGRYGFMAAKSDAQSVAETILNAFRDFQRLQKMGDEGQQWCLQHYTWDRVAARILEVIFDAKNGLNTDN